jgi:hypothetical protein
MTAGKESAIRRDRERSPNEAYWLALLVKQMEFVKEPRDVHILDLRTQDG